MTVAPRWLTTAIGVAALSTGGAAAHEAERSVLFDQAQAMAYSQRAVGRSVGEHRFVTSRGEAFVLSETRGKPLVVNFIYTSCSDACPLTVQTLARAADVAASAVGPDSFAVVTVGFDARADTPRRLYDFARAQGVNRRNWRFLSGDAATVERLAEELGFLYVPSAGGFDHLAQVSLVDAEGRVVRQIYGTDFAPQLLVEPLKQLVFGAAASTGGFTGLLDRVKLLCTVFDPATGRYRFSYAIFVEIVAGGLSLAVVGIFLVRLMRQARRPASRGS